MIYWSIVLGFGGILFCASGVLEGLSGANEFRDGVVAIFAIAASRLWWILRRQGGSRAFTPTTARPLRPCGHALGVVQAAVA